MLNIQITGAVTNLVMALCLSAVAGYAQTDRQPWQGTFTKNIHPAGPRIFIDLPLPATGRVLTLERIGITVGPMSNPYSKVHSCEIESARPRLPDFELLDNRTRVPLPPPVLLVNGTKTFVIFHTPIRIYAAASETGLRELFRVSCASEFMMPGEAMTVTAVGYTSPK